jgi:hypothetical protein
VAGVVVVVVELLVAMALQMLAEMAVMVFPHLLLAQQ